MVTTQLVLLEYDMFLSCFILLINHASISLKHAPASSWSLLSKFDTLKSYHLDIFFKTFIQMKL